MSASALLEIIATLCAGLFAGAAVYITFVEHPARLECGTELAVTEFAPSYRRAAVMQASLAAIGLTCAGVDWFGMRDPEVLVGGLLLGLVIPLTLIAIRPVNDRLLDPDLDLRSDAATTLLQRWGRLHAVRSLLGTFAFAILLRHLAIAAK